MTSTLIVVLNWNGADDTVSCIQSLEGQSFKDFSVLVVDNGSTLSDYEKVNALANEKVTVIRNDKNLGFAGGVNTGIRYAIEHGYEYVTLLNNDATVDTKWVESLQNAFAVNPEIAAVTSLLLHEDGKTIDSTGDYYSVWGIAFPRLRNQPTNEAPDSGYVFGASGGATMYKTALFTEIGLFDEDFFAYYEDVDVSFRAQLRGHKVYYTKEAVAYHKQGATSKKIPGFTVYQTFKNLPLLYIKNVPGRLLFPVGMRLFVLYWLFFGNAIRKGSGWSAFKGWLASIWYFWTSALPERFTIQSHKKVPTDYIADIIYRDLPPDQTGMRKLRSFFTGK